MRNGWVNDYGLKIKESAQQRIYKWKWKASWDFASKSNLLLMQFSLKTVKSKLKGTIRMMMTMMTTLFSCSFLHKYYSCRVWPGIQNKWFYLIGNYAWRILIGISYHLYLALLINYKLNDFADYPFKNISLFVEWLREEFTSFHFVSFWWS